MSAFQSKQDLNRTLIAKVVLSIRTRREMTESDMAEVLGITICSEREIEAGHPIFAYATFRLIWQTANMAERKLLLADLNNQPLESLDGPTTQSIR